MSVDERAVGERVLEARDRYVSGGVSTPRLVVARAEGARVWNADGREYLDFGGGIACQNLGHGPASVVRAIHEQADRYLHQCFMVGMYEPYVEVCRRLAVSWPGAQRVRPPSRSPYSSTRARRRSRTPSRSPARPRAARPSSSSTAPSTAARC